ncbi:phage tail protein [Pseudomonas sp. CAM1A]|uniref:phage tail protein n=1 Tax=Pseudomonas sp. CAM1A TaxID=3231717 RepID=UPI0039C6FED3
MDYPKRTPGIGLVGGKFADENASTGQPGSLIPATWGNAVTDELLAVIKAAGLTPSEDDSAQLLQAIQGLAASDVKRAVRAATTGPIALSGLQTIDGVALVAGDRVLVKDQANAAQNWIYTASAAAWPRALDANDDAECTPGHLIIVQAGTAYAGTMWQLSNTQPPQVGTTQLTFGMLFGKTGVAAGSYRQVTVDTMGRVTGGTNPTTLGGYGINDAYTKTFIDNALSGKANNQDVYSKTYIDSALSGKANKSTTLAGYGITDAIPNVNPLPYGSYDLHGTNYAFVSSQLESSVCQNAYWDGVDWKKHNASKEAVALSVQDGKAYVRTWAVGTPAYTASRIIDSSMEATVPELDAGVTPAKWVSVAGLAYYVAAKLKAASETVAGFCRFATLNEVVTGASGYLAVAPAYLVAGFSYTFGSNGFVKLPTWLGGFMFQWAYSDESNSATDYRYFPVPFPNVAFGGWLQLEVGTINGFAGSYGTIVQVVDNTRYVWTAGGTFGGGGKGWILAVGR